MRVIIKLAEALLEHYVAVTRLGRQVFILARNGCELLVLHVVASRRWRSLNA